MDMKKIVVAIGGASGSVYAAAMLEKLHAFNENEVQTAVVVSDNARINWELEMGRPFETTHKLYDKKDFNAPFASGSSKWDTMIVCPCSMGLLGRIASGISNDLVTRAADVMLKERRRLILVTRETPLSLIHIQNMKNATLAGAIICPATPSFYHQPKTVNEVVQTVVDRVLDLAELNIQTKRWGEN